MSDESPPLPFREVVLWSIVIVVLLVCILALAGAVFSRPPLTACDASEVLVGGTREMTVFYPRRAALTVTTAANGQRVNPHNTGRAGSTAVRKYAVAALDYELILESGRQRIGVYRTSVPDGSAPWVTFECR